MLFMTISQRIFDELKKQGKKDLAQHIGLSTSAVSDWKKKGTNPAAENISAIADFLNISTDYLLMGKEKSSSKDKLSDDEQELIGYFKKFSDKSKGIVLGKAETLAELEAPVEPVIKEESEEYCLKINCSTYRVSAGIGFELGEGDEWYEIEVPDTPEARKADFALKIKGNSMEPIYFDGDIVLVK